MALSNFSTRFLIDKKCFYLCAQKHEKTFFVFVFDRVEELLDRIPFNSGQERKLALYMDRQSFSDFVEDIPCQGDDNIFGRVMFALSTVSGYASVRFDEKGFRILNTGMDSDSTVLRLDVQKV